MPARVMIAVFVLVVAVPVGADAGGGGGCATPCARTGETRSASGVYEEPGLRLTIDATWHEDLHISGSGVEEHMATELRIAQSGNYGDFECVSDPANLTFTLTDGGRIDVAVAEGDCYFAALTFHFVPNGNGTTTDSPLVSATPPGAEVGTTTAWPTNVSYETQWGDTPFGTGTNKTQTYDLILG